MYNAGFRIVCVLLLITCINLEKASAEFDADLSDNALDSNGADLGGSGDDSDGSCTMVGVVPVTITCGPSSSTISRTCTISDVPFDTPMEQVEAQCEKALRRKNPIFPGCTISFGKGSYVCLYPF